MLFQQVQKMAAALKLSYSWDERSSWEISDDAWHRIEKAGIEPLIFFVHPNILRQYPGLVKYYRCISTLSRKGLKTLSGLSNLEKLEKGDEKEEIPEEKMQPLVTTLNRFLSTIVLSSSNFNSSKIEGIMYATAGVTVDGSWRNAIGSEGERVIRAMLLKRLIDNNEIKAFIEKNGLARAFSKDDHNLPDKVEQLRSVILINGSSLIFGSEPDITIVAPNGKVSGGVEIKAGLDPAGALERLGAMIKSFENILSSHPGAKTILVASCLTDEVKSRLMTSNSAAHIYPLLDIVNDRRNLGEKFINTVRSLLELISKRI